MGDISTWSPVDESNTAAPPNGWPENMQPSAVNNSARAIMGAVRRWYDTVNAQLGNFLPLSGGTLTGHLNGTSISTTGPMTAATVVNTTGYQLSGVPFAGRQVDGYHVVYDYAGVASLFLGGSNIYRADTHAFQNNDGGASAPITTGNITAGAVTTTTITAAGGISAPNITLTNTGISTTGLTASANINANAGLIVQGTSTLKAITGTTITTTSGISGPSVTATGSGMSTTNLVASANITAGSYTTSSDSRIKQNIRPFKTGLAAIQQLNPVGFEYRETSPVTPGETAYGLVADDVVDILPEMVGEAAFDIAGTLTALKTLDQGHVPLVLINAVKELAMRVEALEAGR